MKKTLLTTLATMACYFLIAQPSASYDKRASEELYWKYRERLKEFVVVGNAQGKSLPAHKIGYDDRDIRETGSIGFGDEGIELGWYISMLATEYALLEASGRPTEQAVEELYYALNAYERIDIAGDTHRCVDYPQGAFGMNGFFIRDDVDQTLFENNPEFAARFVNPENVQRGGFDFGSDYVGHACSDRMGFFNSPDQVASLYMGFALVKKGVPASVTFNGQSLRQMAINSARAIAEHYKQNLWRGAGPDGRIISKFHSSFFEEMEALGLAGAADWIIGTGDHYTNSAEGIYPGLFFLTVAKEAWRERFQVGSIAHNKLKKSYREKRDDFVVSHNMILAAIASNIAPQKNSYKVRRRIAETAIFFDVQIFALLNSYLHGTGLVESGKIQSHMENHLAIAPCSGPHFYYEDGGLENGVRGWRAPNRWIRSMQGALGGWGDNVDKLNFDYNGLDYMVAHNLFLLYNRLNYENPTDQIAGEFELCNGQTNTYRYMPAAEKIEWSTSRDLEIIGSTMGSSVNVKRSGIFNYGGTWIRAHVTKECGILVTEKKIAGSNPVAVIDASKERYSYRLDLKEGDGSWPIAQQQINNVAWELLNANPSYVSLDPLPTGLSANLSGRGTPWSATVKVTISNECGTATLYEYLDHEGDTGSGSGGGEIIGGPVFGGIANPVGDISLKQGEVPDVYTIYMTEMEDPGPAKPLVANTFQRRDPQNAAVFSLDGQQMKTFYSNEFYVGDLPAGLYILKVVVDGQVLDKKVIVK